MVFLKVSSKYFQPFSYFLVFSKYSNKNLLFPLINFSDLPILALINNGELLIYWAINFFCVWLIMWIRCMCHL